MPRDRDKEFAREIGGRIEDFRLQRGKSQKELARMASVDPRTIRAIEAGKQLPSFVTLHLISRALEIPAGIVLDGEGD
jgi:transcriptional regulator with XRE-family HTH domain